MSDQVAADCHHQVSLWPGQHTTVQVIYQSQQNNNDVNSTGRPGGRPRPCYVLYCCWTYVPWASCHLPSFSSARHKFGTRFSNCTSWVGSARCACGTRTRGKSTRTHYVTTTAARGGRHRKAKPLATHGVAYAAAGPDQHTVVVSCGDNATKKSGCPCSSFRMVNVNGPPRC